VAHDAVVAHQVGRVVGLAAAVGEQGLDAVGVAAHADRVLQAFPNATLWLSGDLLIGSPSPLRLSRSELESRLADPAARASLAEVGLNHAQDVLSQFRATDAELRAYAGPGPILTDNRPLLEYFLALNESSAAPDLSHFSNQPNTEN
jgi:hypothetical protein